MFFSKLASPKKLNAKGIMGMNQRNINYIGKYNNRNKYPLVDNKLKKSRVKVKKLKSGSFFYKNKRLK